MAQAAQSILTPAPRAASDDYQLMEQIAAGHEAALAALYERHSPIVFALCLRVLDDRSSAEEVTLDVFWELWNRRDRFDAGRGAPRSYLLGVARSRATDRLRSDRAKRRQPRNITVASDEASAMTTADKTPGPADQMQVQEQGQQVRTALDQLDPGHRRALELAYYQALSHSEIAAELGEPLGTIKSRIRAAVTRLRDLLGPRESP